jgi:hypothetical protein
MLIKILREHILGTHGNFFAAKRLFLCIKEKVKKAELCCGIYVSHLSIRSFL